ncbi:hypothetical protein [Oryzobacter telluris]|uniref:hypothetical protein n=1 Tax=Oryzobacter telluris TaxID=3149179 RepID=UPI00370D5B95
MNQNQSQTTTTSITCRVGTGRRVLAGLAVPVLTGLFAVGLGATPAQARDDAGPAATVVGHAGACFLERVGDQLVRCDDLTGNGVPAPGYIPER